MSALILTGCATVQNSAFDGETKKLDFSENSYFVLGVEINHAVKPKYNPNTQIILYVEKPDAESKADRFNVLLKPAEFQISQNGAVSGYFRGALPPGEYVLKAISGFSRKLLINGNYFLPLDSSFQLEKNEVAYLGKLRARTRKRRTGEFRAGSVVPLLDQGVSGFSSSTFDVEVSDDSESAKSWMNKAYPALASEELTIKILAKYDRSQFDGANAKAQADPVFVDEKAAEVERSKNSSSLQSAYPEIVTGLNSSVSKEFQQAAQTAHKKKFYTDGGVLNAMIARTEQALENPNLVADKIQIDAFAYCMISFGRSNDSRIEPLLNKVVQSQLPRKMRSHAISALKRIKKRS